MKYIAVKFVAATVLSMTAIASGWAGKVYIPEGSAGHILIVDAASDTIIGTINGVPEIHGLGSVPSNGLLVAGSYMETSADEPPVVDKPKGVSEDEHAAHHGGGSQTAKAKAPVSLLTIIDAAEGLPVKRLEVPGAVHHVAVSPDGRFAVATHPNADGVSVIDLRTMIVSSFLGTGSMPNYAVFSANGASVFVSNSGNGTVSEIDTGKWFVRRNMLAGEFPEHIALTPDGRELFVTNTYDGKVSVLTIDRGEIDRVYALGGELHGIDLGDDGKTLFVSGTEANQIIAIDTKSGAIRRSKFEPSPYHLTVIPGTGKLYVSSAVEPKVWVIDQKNLENIGEIPLTDKGHQMAIAP